MRHRQSYQKPFNSSLPEDQNQTFYIYLEYCLNYSRVKKIQTLLIFNKVPNLMNLIISVQFSRSVMSDSLQPHELQYSSSVLDRTCQILSLTDTVLDNIPEFAQTHVHWVSDALPPSHPPSPPSPTAFNLSQHRGHFQWVSSSHQMVNILEFHLQHQSFQWLFSIDFL